MTSVSHDLTRTVLALLFICGLLWAAFLVVQPFLAAIVWATTLVIATWPLLLIVDWVIGFARLPGAAVVWWTGMFGVLGLPSAVPPIGRTVDGLPVGIQVVAPYLRDRDAVRLAGLLAGVAGGYEPPPGC
jgi:hypothetical protein